MNSLFAYFDSAWAIAGLIVGFSFLIFVHELGHYLVAKWVGIKVTQFAIGFGPSIVAWRKGLGLRWGSTEAEYEKHLAEPTPGKLVGETEYRLNWIPLGGYVKMHGQEDLNPEASACRDEQSFNAKPIWARACVVSAGVVMNLIFGAVFFVIAFMAGVEFPPAIAGMVLPNSPAANTYAVGHQDDEAYRGLRTGDRITHIDGRPVTDFADMAVNAALAGPDQTLMLTVSRDGEPATLNFPIKPRADVTTEMLTLGVGRPISLTLIQPGHGSLPSVLTASKIQPGMQLIRVAGQPVQWYQQYESAIAAARGRSIQVDFIDPKSGQTQSVEMAAIPRVTPDASNRQLHVLGLIPAIQIPGVIPKSPAEKAGLRAGDTLVRIGPSNWPTWNQVVELIDQTGTRPIAVEVLRNRQRIELGPITPSYNGKIGIFHGLALDDNAVAQVLPDSPFANLNLNPGSRILTINDEHVDDFAGIQRLLKHAAEDQATQNAASDTDEPATVTVGYHANIANTPPSLAQIQLDADWIQRIMQAQWDEPMGPSVFQMLVTPLAADNPIAATKLGIKKTHQVMLQTYVTLLRLFQGTVPASQMRGPLGIADAGTSFAKKGWPYLMFFLGLISVNLVVINFLPIPIVDGGLMVFLLIEKLKGSPVSVRIQTAATVVGLAMIGSVLLLTLFYDAKRLFEL